MIDGATFANGSSQIFTNSFGPGTYTLRFNGLANALANNASPQDLEVTTGAVSFQFIPFGRAQPTLPEPATWAFMVIGFVGLGAMMRRRPATSGASEPSGV